MGANITEKPIIEAAIDIGTITLLMLVAETERFQDSPTPLSSSLPSEIFVKTKKIKKYLHNAIEYPKLGEGVNKNRFFSDEAMDRATKVFEKYKKICVELGVTKITAMATSASRDAKNAKKFYEKIFEQTGINVQIITGEREAELSFLGGLLESQKPSEYCVLDIGGGSTEFVGLADSDNQDQPLISQLISQSLDIGSIRATEMYLTGNPFTPLSLKSMEQGLSNYWASLNPNIQRMILNREWVAIAGTPTVLAGIKLGVDSFTSDKIDGVKLTKDEVWEYYEMLSKKSLKERQEIPLIGTQRGDVIVAGVSILATAMKKFNKAYVTVSTRGLRHGVLTTG